MVPILSKRRQRNSKGDDKKSQSTNNTKMMIEVVTSNTHNTQHVNKTTISTHTNQTSAISTKQVCSICNKNNVKYKCPRCNISYCSVSCYQIHHGTSSNTTPDHSSNSNKVCSESLYKRHSLINLNTTTNIVQQSVLSNINNDININLDKLEQRDERISQLITKNEGDGGVIVNGMMEEIKDNICKSNRAMDVFRIDRLNNSKEEEVVHEISSTSKQDRVQEQYDKKNELSIDLLISGMNVMDSNDNNDDDSDMLSSGILILGLGSGSTQRPLVVEDEMVSISTIRKK